MMILKSLLGSAIRSTLSNGFPRQQQFRERALFHDTELSRIGIALAGQRQQLDRIFHAARDVMAHATRWRCLRQSA